MASPRELEEHFRRNERGFSEARMAREARERKLAHGLVERHRVRPGGGGQPRGIALADTFNIVKENDSAAVNKSASGPSVMAKRIQPVSGPETDWWIFIRWAVGLANWQRFVIGAKLYIDNGSTSPVLINSGGPLDIVEAYVMTEDWDPDTLCWDNKPSLPSGAIDFQITTWVNASAGETEWDGNAGFMAMCWNRLGSIVSPDAAVGCAIKVTSFSEFHTPGSKDGATEVQIQSDGGFALVAF